MTDITNIKQYLEWKAEREGRMIDTSPEAWLYDMSVSELYDAINNAIENGHMKSDHVIPLGQALYVYENAKEALNVD